jgi:hypothetical protein
MSLRPGDVSLAAADGKRSLGELPVCGRGAAVSMHGKWVSDAGLPTWAQPRSCARVASMSARTSSMLESGPDSSFDAVTPRRPNRLDVLLDAIHRLCTNNGTRTVRRDSVCLTASMLIGNGHGDRSQYR